MTYVLEKYEEEEEEPQYCARIILQVSVFHFLHGYLGMIVIC